MPKESFSPDELQEDPLEIQKTKHGKSLANPKKNEVLVQKGLQKDFRASELKIFGPDYFFNYELSWLKFNWRVLSEAEDNSVPLFERIKFIGIVCSNLDEFFQKRIGGLKRQLHAGVKDLTVDGRTPKEQLNEIRSEVKKMIRAYRDCYFEQLLPELR